MFVIDVSGSMNSAFPGDTDGRSKLQVAVDCIAAIVSQLQEGDQIAAFSFTTVSDVVSPLKMNTQRNRSAFLKTLKNLRASGRTALNKGLERGYKVLREYNQTMSMNSRARNPLLPCLAIHSKSLDGVLCKGAIYHGITITLHFPLRQLAILEI